MFNLLKSMFTEWTSEQVTAHVAEHVAEHVRCAACRGRGDDCVCPEDFASSLPVDVVPLGSKPVVSFQIHCELTPWAPECKIYED